MKTKFLTWLIAILFLCGISAFAQPTSGIYLPQTVTSYGSHFARAVVDSAFGFPTGNGAPSTLQSSYRGLAMFRYDSTAGQLYIYNPKSSVMAWSVVSGGGTTVVSDSAWSLDGNANASGKFLGTTTAQDLIIKANNTELIRLLSTGGIRLPATVDSTTGVIFKGSDRFIHSYQNPATRTDLGQSLYIGRKSGNFNFTGASAGYGGRNLAIGDSTLFANTTGYRNVAIGVWNSNSNTTGFENTSVGANAFEKNIDGYDNTAIGAISMKFNTTGWRNTALGFSALQNNISGTRNTAIGGRAILSSSTSFANVAVGFDAMYFNTIGDHNVGVGLDALYYSDGTHNVAIGDSTLWGLYPTYGWSANQKHMGYKNTAIGSRAGYHKGDSIFNYASIFDTAVTFLGANASRDSSIPYSTSLQNMTVIGYDARGFASNQVVLGNDDVTTTLLKGTVGIGTRTPDASSIFDGVSTTKGVLLPRMNTTQQNAIASPAVGLIIFNTDTADYMVYKVSSWVRIGGGSSGGGGTVTGTGTTNTISKWTSSTAIGNSSLNDDGSMVSTASQLWVSKTGAVSTPGVAFTGAWYSGGSGTTTKAYLLIEPTAATSTGWSTSGTGIGINAASGFTGNLIDAQLNGVSKFSVSSAGTVTMPTPFTLGATSVTSTGTQLNYLNAATGTTGTASSNIVFSASPTLTGTATTAAITASGALTLSASAQTPASFSSSFAGNMQVNWNSTTGNNVNFVFQDAGTARWYIGNNSATGSDRLHILNSSAQEAITVLQGLQVGINQTAPTARLHLGAGVSTASYAPLKFTTGTSNTTAEAGAMEYTTPQLFFTNGRAVRQEIFQGQQARVSTQYDNTTTTLGNVTGLTANVAASGTYRFEAKLYTTSDVAGGIKVAIGGTATATAIRYEGLTTDAGLTTQSRATALGTAVGAVTAVTAAYVVITGTITVNAAGTLTVQAAANAATGTTSVLTGSTFVITEML